MAPKGKKGLVKRGQEAGEKEKLDEVEKLFYELQLRDIHQRIARLTERNAELEEEIDETKKVTQKLADEKADVISFMKRTLNSKLGDVEDIKERIKAEQKARELDKEMYIEKVKMMELDFKKAHEELISEIKLLMGKLNALEEFRQQRDELIKKYEYQEVLVVQREEEHIKKLQEIERKFMIAKDELKKDMEAKLLRVSLEFQRATQKRISQTTQRVIRENVAVKNELETLEEIWKKLTYQYSELQTKSYSQVQDIQYLENDTYENLEKNKIHLKVVGKMTDEYEILLSKYKEISVFIPHTRDLEKEFTLCKKELTCWQEKLQKVEQLLHYYKTSKPLFNQQMNETLYKSFQIETIMTNAKNLILKYYKKSNENEVNLNEKLTKTVTYDQLDERKSSLHLLSGRSEEEELQHEEMYNFPEEYPSILAEESTEQIEDIEPQEIKEAIVEETLIDQEGEEESFISFSKDDLINTLIKLLQINLEEERIESADTIDITNSYLFNMKMASEMTSENTSSSSCT